MTGGHGDVNGDDPWVIRDDGGVIRDDVRVDRDHAGANRDHADSNRGPLGMIRDRAPCPAAAPG
jgi:hypothetical protein